jgi:hypothetical protein
VDEEVAKACIRQHTSIETRRLRYPKKKNKQTTDEHTLVNCAQNTSVR